MTGKYHVMIQNSRVRFEFDISRNLTVVRGDSATGKTTLMSLLESYDRLGDESGIEVVCKKRCLTADNAHWEAVISSANESIIFMDEDTKAMRTREFARTLRENDNYYVLITREDLPNLPYSVEEVYGIRTSGKYADLQRTYNSFYRLYSPRTLSEEAQIDAVIVEDSNAGFSFFQGVAAEGIEVRSAGGKAKIREALVSSEECRTLVIADGAAFGPEMATLYLYMKSHPEVLLYLPESFEWLVLSSGLIDGQRMRLMIDKSWDYVDSARYFSWEQFYTHLLVSETEGTYLQYSKRSLNNAYLGKRARDAILGSMEVVAGLLTGDSQRA